MKKPLLKYVDSKAVRALSKAVRALLERYACPVPFHVVRMRFFGNIASPDSTHRPLKPLSASGAENCPSSINRAAANELGKAMMSL